MPKIDFNPKLFNPNYWHVIKAMANIALRFIWLYGGSASSKTYSIVQAIITKTLEEATDTIVFRKTNASIEKTVFKDFETIIIDWDMKNVLFRITKSPLRIRCVNGAVIDFAGLDDSEKIKGISQYKRVFCNEISAFEENDYRQIRKRLRGQEGQQIISDFNPIDELHWIKENVFDKEEQNPEIRRIKDAPVDPRFTRVAEKWINSSQVIKNPVTGKEENIPANMLVIRSTYLNNYWTVGSPCGTFGFYDTQTVVDFEADKNTDYNFYRIYALGEWGKVSVGGEFYKRFNATDNVVSAIPWDKDLPLHISFDENVNPYLSLSIYQAEDKKTWKIDEICLKHPNNTLNHTLTEFMRRYPPNKAGLFVYGDRTSLKEDTKLEKGQNFYTIIMDRLAEYDPVQRLPSKNPPVAMRGNFINEEVLGRGKMGLSYVISDKCKNTIADYLYVKEASDGTKLKEKGKDPNTKVQYEKWGHLSDTDDYFLCWFFSVEFANYQRGPIHKPIMGGRRVSYKTT